MSIIRTAIAAIALACMTPVAYAQEAAPACTNLQQVEDTFKGMNVPFRVLTGDELALFDSLVTAAIGQQKPEAIKTIVIMDPTAEGFPEDATVVMIGGLDVNGCLIATGRLPVQFAKAILIQMEPV